MKVKEEDLAMKRREEILVTPGAKKGVEICWCILSGRDSSRALTSLESPVEEESSLTEGSKSR